VQSALRVQGASTRVERAREHGELRLWPTRSVFGHEQWTAFIPSFVCYFIDSSRDFQVFHTIAGDQTRLYGPEPQTGRYTPVCGVGHIPSTSSQNRSLSFRSTLFAYWLRRPYVLFIKTVSSRIEYKYTKAPRGVIQEQSFSAFRVRIPYLPRATVYLVARRVVWDW